MGLTQVNSDGVSDGSIKNADIKSDAAIAKSKLAALNIVASDITDDTITEAKLDISNTASDGQYLQYKDSTDKLTWATVTVPASYDDTNVRKDISKLALQIAVDTNRSAYNLTNSFIDQFEDDSGLGTQTGCDRTTDEYMTTVIDSWGSDTEYKESDLNASNLVNSNSDSFTASTLLDSVISTGMYGMYIINSSGYNKGFYYEVGADSDFGLKTKITAVRWYSINTIARFAYWRIYTSQDGTNFTNIASTGADDSTTESDGVTLKAGNNDAWNRGNFATPFQVSNTNAKVLLKFGGYYNNGNQYAGIGEFRLYAQKYTGTTNATGTLISTAQTASSSRTKVSGTFLYKNASGTATIGTDLKIYFTCNGGTNWTEAASYTAGSDFSSGIKTIYMGETTCTAGTDVRYKAVWANQADGSKETQLHGIGVNY